jgi:hypothetical protein
MIAAADAPRVASIFKDNFGAPPGSLKMTKKREN